jgi:hypothetical protein
MELLGLSGILRSTAHPHRYLMLTIWRDQFLIPTKLVLIDQGHVIHIIILKERAVIVIKQVPSQ